ncbi:hypothetical protein HDU93_001665 [Gonapodya sp. JEL0774]|nr:hypothetical protein HDU93_001665 [Gonapodya sp. JEL0774]
MMEPSESPEHPLATSPELRGSISPPPFVDGASATAQTHNSGPQFIKLIGAPPPNKPEPFAVPSPSRIIVEPVVDVLDAGSDEPFTLEPFLSLIKAHALAGKEFVLARVNTVDPSNESRSYYSYYSAHFINKVLFRTQPEAGLLHRMRARNPLTNTVIVGDVHYFSITPESALATLSLTRDSPSRDKPPSPSRPTLHDILRTATGRSPTSLHPPLGQQSQTDETVELPPSPLTDSSASTGSPSGFGIHDNAPRGRADGLTAIFTHGNFSYDNISAYVHGFLPLPASPSNPRSQGRPPSPARSLFTSGFSSSSYHSRPGSPDSFRSTDTRVARVRFTLKPSFQLATAKESARMAKMANGEFELNKIDLGWRRMNPDGTSMSDDVHRAAPDVAHRYPQHTLARRNLYSHSFANSPAAATSPGEWMRTEGRDLLRETMVGNETGAHSRPTSGVIKRAPRKASGVGTLPPPVLIVNEQDKAPRMPKSKLSDNALSATANSSSNDQASPVTFNLLFHSTDDDFLMHASIRAYFKANALDPNDAVLFTLNSTTSRPTSEAGDQGTDHPLLDGIQVYEFEDGDYLGGGPIPVPEPDFGSGLRGLIRKSLWKFQKLSTGVKFLMFIYFPLGFLLVKLCR